MASTIEEIEVAQRAERVSIKNDAELLQGLVKHPGWPRYLALIEAIAQNYNKEAMRPLENVWEVTKGEFAKGALMGLTLAAAAPSAKIREANELTRNTEHEDE